MTRLVIMRGIDKRESPVLNSDKSRIAIVDAQTRIQAVPRILISMGTFVASYQLQPPEGWWSIQGMRRNNGRKSKKAYSNKPVIFFHGIPQRSTQVIVEPQII